MEIKVTPVIPKTIEYEVVIRLTELEMETLRTENIYEIPPLKAPIASKLLSKITNHPR